MKKLLLVLLLSPIFMQAQRIDHHIKARQNAYASVVCIGLGTMMASGIIATDTDNAPQAMAVMGSFGAASMVFYLFAWHHVGEAGRQTSLYVKPEGVTLAFKF